MRRREADRELRCQKRAATRDAYSSYSWCPQSCCLWLPAARRALEWIGMSKARLVIRREISDSDVKIFMLFQY